MRGDSFVSSTQRLVVSVTLSAALIVLGLIAVLTDRPATGIGLFGMALGGGLFGWWLHRRRQLVGNSNHGRTEVQQGAYARSVLLIGVLATVATVYLAIRAVAEVSSGSAGSAVLSLIGAAATLFGAISSFLTVAAMRPSRGRWGTAIAKWWLKGTRQN